MAKSVELQEPKLRARDVRAIRAELESIRQQNADGLLVVEEAVQFAANEGTALHGQLEWDDSVAGHQFRCIQMRSVIRTVKVTMPDDPEENLLPRYVSLISDRHKEGGGYRQTRDVVNSKSLLAELEETAKKELQAWISRHKLLSDLVERVRVAAGIKERQDRKASKR